ncbi:MAG: undecaprenyl-diphosphate phosphatase [Lachnospiraceae bacterium]|nr:undecaprenyl-diphosphate phosphatase [Lachnospiraceae bacterium]
MIEFLKAILFGVVEGITEWLPVSSTGHMILLNEFVKLDVSAEFYSFFQVVIQLGAILSVVILFWSKIWPFGKKNNNAPLSDHGFGQYIKKDIFVLWFHIIFACIPAIIVGVLLDDLFEELFYNYVTVSIMLILVGIAFIVVETLLKNRRPRIKRPSQINYQLAFIIGLYQVIAAIFPGTSRSGAIIVGALTLGIARTAAAEFAFYLAIPVMFGASLLKLVKFGFHFTGHEVAILATGCVVAFVVSLFVIKFLMGYIRKHDFKVFGYYRIVLGVVVLAFGFLGLI